jgi:soluble lytic murein transglycosylase-like protein
MAGETVIDQLVVKLGLDPSNFTKGQKQAAAALVSTEKQVEKSSTSMGSQLVGVAGKFLGVVSAIQAVRKVVGYVSDLSTATRKLGLDAGNFGIAANKLRNFQNAAEMLGGSAEEITKTIGGLQKAVFDLAYNGTVSDSLVMLGRLGVRFQDASGNARDFKDIILDTADAIEQAQKQGMTRANAVNFLQESGLDQGSIQLALLGRAGAEKELAIQDSRRQVGKTELDAATAWERSGANRDQAIAAAALRGLPAASAAGVAGNNLIAAGADAASSVTLGGVAEKAASGVHALTSSIEGLWNSLQTGARGYINGHKATQADFNQTINDAAKRNGIDPALLAGVLRTESNFNPGAVNAKSGARGIAQLNPKYYPHAGANPYDDIQTAASILAHNRDSFLKSGEAGDENTAWELALMAYNAGETRVRSSLKGGKPLAQETVDYPGKVLAQPSPRAQVAAGGGTSVQIDSITVNTQATDAAGVAQDMDGALKRKLLASHAETGMQ